MNLFYRKILAVTTFLLFFLIVYLWSCKKIDLERVAAISTENITDITNSSVRATGTIVDAGTNTTDYGFCWSTGGTPTINDFKVGNGPASSTGEYSNTITGLSPNTNYTLRSYIDSKQGVKYGDTKQFQTTGTIDNEWLHYDNDINPDGIGYTDGGSWDVAIRFPSVELQKYNGAKVTKVRFIVYESDVTEYYVTLWVGNEPPEMIILEKVDNINLGDWTTFTLPSPHYIDTSKDLWVGYWIVDQPVETYPAGVDYGPAVSGFGDLYSNDDGVSWYPLSAVDPPNLNYNWNIQFYVENNDKSIELVSKNSKESVNERFETKRVNNNAIPTTKSE